MQSKVLYGEVKGEVLWFFWPLLLKIGEIRPLLSYKIILEQREERNDLYSWSQPVICSSAFWKQTFVNLKNVNLTFLVLKWHQIRVILSPLGAHCTVQKASHSHCREIASFSSTDFFPSGLVAQSVELSYSIMANTIDIHNMVLKLKKKVMSS